MIESGRRVEFTRPAIPELSLHAGGQLAEVSLTGDTDDESYARLESLCGQLSAAGRVRTVLLVLNVTSTAWGAHRAVRAIQQLRLSKFVVAWVDTAFGLSYQLAAASHAIWCAPVSRVGYFAVRVVPEFRKCYPAATGANLTTAVLCDIEALRPQADMAAVEYLANRAMLGEQAERAGLVDSCEAQSAEELRAILLRNIRSVKQL